MADSRQLVERGRYEARSYRQTYDDDIPSKVLSDRLAGYVQMYTLYASVRPFGCSLLLAVYDKKGPKLFMIEPSGVAYVCFILCWGSKLIFCKGYFACAIGKGRQAAKTELEKLKLQELTCIQAVNEIARMYPWYVDLFA